MHLNGRVFVFGLAAVLAAATALADTVVTAREVVVGSIQAADSSFVRLKLPGHAIRVFATSEVYELRFADSARVAEFSGRLSMLSVAPDSGQPVPATEVRVEALRPRSPAAALSAARERALEREGYDRAMTSIVLQTPLAVGGGVGLTALGACLTYGPGGPGMLPIAAGSGAAGCLGGTCAGAARPRPPAGDTLAAKAYMRGYGRGLTLSSVCGLVAGTLALALPLFLVAFVSLENGY